jgi:hypothetical protein
VAKTLSKLSVAQVRNLLRLRREASSLWMHLHEELDRGRAGVDFSVATEKARQTYLAIARLAD